MAGTSLLQLEMCYGNSGNDDSDVKKKTHLQSKLFPHYATGCYVHNTAILQSIVEGSHAFLLENLFSLAFSAEVGKVAEITSPDCKSNIRKSSKRKEGQSSCSFWQGRGKLWLCGGADIFNLLPLISFIAEEYQVKMHEPAVPVPACVQKPHWLDER